MQSSNKATAVSATGKRLRPAAGRPKNASPGRSLSPEKVTATFLDVGQKLRAGLSSEAQKTLVQTIENYRHSADEMADLKRLLAFTLETLGRYTEALEVLKPYESEELLGELTVETRTKVQTQLAISYNNLGDHPRAVTLLKETLAAAKKNELTRLFGTIDLALARVYRKLNELPICRDYAEKSLVYFRESGDWLNMAEAYREVALSYSLSGNSSRSLEYFELGIQIIGDRSAPFMLGKIYTEMSGAYWFLRRPHDGIECLEKSIAFFDQTEHLLNSVIAYNNLGINLTLVGEWSRAEKMIKRALDLAVRSNHVHAAGILDSLGELKILRGELNEAEELLLQAVAFARERNREWYVAQAMRNLARCYLAQGNLRKAAAKARETIELGKKIGEKNYANMAGLVLAESMIAEGKIEDAETELQQVEANETSSDFFVLGNIQRIRGLAALENGDPDLAVHYFYRSLTTFEAAEDIYHAGLVHLLIGTNLGVDKSHRAIKQLARAREIFAKLGVDSLANEAAAAIKKLESTVPTPGAKEEKKKNSVVSQLLTVRLAEAVASRELLFRELVAVLQQESPARRIIVAQPDDRKNLIPFITHGYSPSESSELVANLDGALKRNEQKVFARAKNIEVLPLKAANSSGAYLMIFPQSAAQLNDGSALQPLLRVVELGMEVVTLRDRDRAAPIEQESSPYASNSLMPGFIHSSPGMTALIEEVYKIRSSDVTVLVTGDSGTGKELVSRAIHTLSNRKDTIFVPFNCTAVPKELAEGHLFGYRKGSFTGAVADSPGIIRAADGGTLFLDEIGDLPLDVQPKLLRFLQEGEVQTIGEKEPIKVDVRVIAATNMPLEQKVAEGLFREDLYYRLNVIRLRVPPLRERRSEIPPIINYYVNHYSTRFGKHDITFAPQTVDLLMVCDWEGNVRQLCNEIQRVIARAVDNEVIMPDHLSPELKRTAGPLTPFFESASLKTIASYDSAFVPFGNGVPDGKLETAVAGLETEMIKVSLARNNWNISRVANELGLTRRGLYMKLSRYGIGKSA